MSFQTIKKAVTPIATVALAAACAFGACGCAANSGDTSSSASSASSGGSATEEKAAAPSVLGKQFIIDTWTHSDSDGEQVVTAEDLGDDAEGFLSIAFKSANDVRIIGFGVPYTGSVQEDDGAVTIGNVQGGDGADGPFTSGLKGTYDGKTLTLVPINANTEQFVLVERNA